MKKSMMNILLWIIAIIFCINGCVMDSPKEEIGIGNDNTAKKAYLSLSLNESRTVLPQALDQTKLTYKLVGRYNEEDHQLGNWTYSDMLAAHTELSVGLWSFTLTANDGVQNVLIGNITNCSIVAGDNPLCFTMKEYSTGTGIISVTARMPRGKVAKVEAVLRDASDDTLIDSKQLSVNECTDDPTQDYALYEIDSANKGLYTLTLRLYQDESDIESINKQMMLVRIEPGCISAGTVTFEQVNTYWHIIYHFEDFDVTDDPVLVTKYNESMHIILPNTYQSKNGDNYYIIGSYNNENRTGDKISEIDYNNNGDIELWVKSNQALAVSSSGLSVLLDTLNSADSPYYIELTDNTPDLDVVKSALTSHNDIKVYLDMKECEGLTSISTNALQGCSSLKGIVIPDSVASIGNKAFYGCSGLTSVTIPNSVTSIGSSAFYNCSGLTSVTIPESVTSIGVQAFYGCSGLTSVTIPNSVMSIGDWAFYFCSRLTSVTIPNSVTSIGSHAFYGCSGLTSVTIPDSVTRIYDYTFSVCSGLTSITIPDSVTSIGSYAFSGCSGLTSITIPNSVTSIGSYAFNNCKGLTSVTIPDSVTSIGSYAFQSCSGLTSIEIPSSVTRIYDDTFAFCGLTSVTIPDSVTSIGYMAFAYCSGLTSVTIPDSVTSIGGMAFAYCGLTSVTIPDSVTSIGSSAFTYCSGLTSMTIGNNVTSIGERAFSNCSGMTTLAIETTIPPNLSSDAFNGCKCTIYVPNDVVSDYRMATVWNEYAKRIHPMSEKDVVHDDETVTKSVSELSSYLSDLEYYGQKVNIIISDPNPSLSDIKTLLKTYPYKINLDLSQCLNLTSIDNQAFSGCSDLTGVTIPDRVTNIGDSAFSGCNGLTSVDYTGTVADWCGIVFGNSYSNPLYYAHNLYIDGELVTDLVIPNIVTEIKQYSFSGCGLTSVTIPDSVTSIGDYAFNGCSGLTSVTIPDSVTSIGGFAFWGCSGLTSVTIGNSVTSIGSSAFNNCKGLTSVTIPSSVTSMGGSAFESCSGLTSVTIPDSVISIGSYAFDGCSGLTSVDYTGTIADWCGITFSNGSANPLYCAHNLYIDGELVTSLVIPNTVTSIGNNAFSYCSSLTSVTIPDSVTSIGDYAFNGCSGLTSVTIPDSVTSIGSYAFSSCSGLTRVDYTGTIADWCGITFSGMYANPLYCAHNLYIDGELVTSLVIPNTVTSIGNYAFYNCSGLTSVTIPDSVTSIGKYAFYNCSGLTSVTIGVGVTNIGSSAFGDCSGLTTLNVKAITPPSFGGSMLYNCSALETIYVPTASVDTYKEASGWSGFADKIEGKSF